VFLHFTLFPIPQVPAERARAAIFVLQSAALLPGLFDIPPVFTVAWSLSYEIFFYGTIPLLVRVTGLQRRRAGARVVFFLGLAVGTRSFTWLPQDGRLHRYGFFRPPIRGC
jgi:peptidoglycan/LPS O-acetylase OafA/YrhL